MSRNLTWQEDSACAGVDTEAFFPSYDIDQRQDAILDALSALKICSTCTVQKQCLEYAMADESSANFGIYAGTLPYERVDRMKIAGEVTMAGGAARFEKQIRNIANHEGIPAPTLGVSLLKPKRNPLWQDSAQQ